MPRRSISHWSFSLFICFGWFIPNYPVPGVQGNTPVPFSPDSSRYKISKIIVTGNETTKEYIVRREMVINEGDVADSTSLTFSRNRVYNLGIFNRVEMRFHSDTLEVHVTEKWYIFPIPVVFINNRDTRKLSYGFHVSDFNFRGRNEILSFGLLFGYSPGFGISYRNPWIGGEKKISLFFNISKYRTPNLSSPINGVEEDHLDADFTIGKRFGYYFWVYGSLSYRDITLPDLYSGWTRTKTGRDRFPIFGLSIRWDDRDLREYPHKGWFIQAWVYKNGWVDQKVDYNNLGIDLRKFFPLSRQLTFGTRFLGGLSLGPVPVYDQLYWGYRNRIRGHFFTVQEGDRLYGFQNELRFPILKIRYYSWENAPEFMREYYQNLKFGLSGALVFDAGKAWYHTLPEPRFQSGAGFGLHVHLPYVNILRFEYVWNENLKPQFIFDFDIIL